MQKGGDLADFRITVAQNLDDNELICVNKSGAIRKADSNSDANYECLKCEMSINGSFLFLRSNNENTALEICDIKVEGKYMHERGFFNILIFF